MNTLKKEQAATYLNISESHLLNLAAAGKIPAAKIGKEWVFHPDLLDTWLRDEIQRQQKQRANKTAPKPATPITRGKRHSRTIDDLPTMPAQA